ncbi:hypothetical protein BKA81DRAFT_377304 [Phyllosticta paracitricarpa]
MSPYHAIKARTNAGRSGTRTPTSSGQQAEEHAGFRRRRVIQHQTCGREGRRRWHSGSDMSKRSKDIPCRPAHSGLKQVYKPDCLQMDALERLVQSGNETTRAEPRRDRMAGYGMVIGKRRDQWWTSGRRRLVGRQAGRQACGRFSNNAR